jgi:hypothetical protein
MPAGRSLPDAAWDFRHRGVVILLWLHVIGIACAEAFLGHALVNSVAEVGIITGATLLASWSTFSRVFRATIAGFGLERFLIYCKA